MSNIDLYIRWATKAEAAKVKKDRLEASMLSRSGVNIGDVRDADSEWQKAVNTATMYGIGAIIDLLNTKSTSA